MIEVEHLSKTYGSTLAIQDVTFAVEEGEILGFLGPNGAGKTTTMRILTGYLPATTGTARIAGYDVHENSMAVRQKIGYLPEMPPLYPEMTVEGYLDFVARLKRLSAGDRPTQVDRAIARCGLDEKRHVMIGKLSKGFRQRVGIAQAIVHNPPVIILDEPTVGLDPRQIIEVRNLIKSLAGDHTIILSTHILPEVSMTCTQVAIISRGTVVANDSLENLMEETQGKSVYEVELEANNPSQIKNTIQEIAGVRVVEPIASEHLSPNHYRFRVTNNPNMEVAPEITSTLSLLGVKLYEIRRLGTSLEDVFLRLTSTDMPNQEFSPLPSSQEWWDQPIAEKTAQADGVEQINFDLVNPENATEKFPPLPSSLEWWSEPAAEGDSSQKKSRNPLAFLWQWFKKSDRSTQNKKLISKPTSTQKKKQPIDQVTEKSSEELGKTESQKLSEPPTQVKDENPGTIPETTDRDLFSEQKEEGEV